jgi:hypothetical protein
MEASVDGYQTIQEGLSETFHDFSILREYAL